MFTTSFKIKDGDKLRFVTQQYEIGTYIAVYKDDNSMPEDQRGINMEEMKFHRQLRRNIEKAGDELLLDESDVMPKAKRKSDKSGNNLEK